MTVCLWEIAHDDWGDDDDDDDLMITFLQEEPAVSEPAAAPSLPGQILLCPICAQSFKSENVCHHFWHATL